MLLLTAHHLLEHPLLGHLLGDHLLGDPLLGHHVSGGLVLPSGRGLLVPGQAAPNPPPGGGFQIPNPAPKAPTEAINNKLSDIISFTKYAALISAAIAFFVGLAVFGAGRVLDHRRAGSTGGLMMASAMMIAILFAGGPAIIQALAQ